MAHETFIFDEARFMQDIEKRFKRALDRLGQRVVQMLTKNLRAIPKSGANSTGKPSWREATISLFKNKLEDSLDGKLVQMAGLVDLDPSSYDMIRAKVLEYGTGLAADLSGGGSGDPIAHRPYVPGLNDDITGHNAPFDTDYYELPIEFNQKPQYWFFEMEVRMEQIIEETLSDVFDGINPWRYIKMTRGRGRV